MSFPCIICKTDRQFANMKIVHINHADNIGGAAIAAYRLSTAMCRAGVDSKMLVYRNLRKNDPMVVGLLSSRSSLFFHQVRIRLLTLFIKYYFKPFGTFSIPYSGMSIHNHPLVKSADVIILHWVSSGMMTMKELERILSLGKPVFWMMHDSYPYTGGCHFFWECDRYTKECEDCLLIGRTCGHGVAHIESQKKASVFKKNNLRFIGPSQWEVDCAKRSSLLKGKQVDVCRNVIDTELFRRKNVDDLKKGIGLDAQKKTILFSAASVKDVYKGWNYMAEAIKMLSPKKYQCVVLGADSTDLSFEMKTFCLGYIRDEQQLSDIYNLADVFVLPSLAESFSLVIAEAMACGVPCVGFNCTAIPGLISHKKNGYLAEYKSVESLVMGVRWICEESDYKSLSDESISFIEENSSFHKVREIYKVVFAQATE